METTEQIIRKQLQDHPVILYMKGTPDAPQCGFSGRAVAALRTTGIPFAHVNILANPAIREGLPKVSQWPTFPQLFAGGELVGGSDIVADMAKSGELQTLLARVATGTHA